VAYLRLSVLVKRPLIRPPGLDTLRSVWARSIEGLNPEVLDGVKGVKGVMEVKGLDGTTSSFPSFPLPSFRLPRSLRHRLDLALGLELIPILLFVRVFIPALEGGDPIGVVSGEGAESEEAAGDVERPGRAVCGVVRLEPVKSEDEGICALVVSALAISVVCSSEVERCRGWGRPARSDTNVDSALDV
jgi:hypothetical protein